MPRWRIVLEAMPDDDGTPAINRLRSLLKRALRAYKLRVAECCELQEPVKIPTVRSQKDERTTT